MTHPRSPAFLSGLDNLGRMIGDGDWLTGREPWLYRPVPGTEESDETGDMQVRLSAVNTMSLTMVLHLAWGVRASPELRDHYRGRVVSRVGL